MLPPVSGAPTLSPELVSGAPRLDFESVFVVPLLDPVLASVSLDRQVRHPHSQANSHQPNRYLANRLSASSLLSVRPLGSIPCTYCCPIAVRIHRRADAVLAVVDVSEYDS